MMTESYSQLVKSHQTGLSWHKSVLLKLGFPFLIFSVVIFMAQTDDLRAQVNQVATPPNIIVVLTDDLSVDLLNALLQSGWAPNIRQYIVENGVNFVNSFVTNAICCPSRATLLRGQYSHNHNVLNINRSFDNGTKVLPGITSNGWFPYGGNPGREESTIATWLQSAGYHTGHIGRYLNGYGICGPNIVCLDSNGIAPAGEPDPRLYIPPGWDSWQTLIDKTTYHMFNYKMNDNGTIVDYGSDASDYQTDVLAERAALFIDEGVISGKPFYLELDTFAPHVEEPSSTTGRFKFSTPPAPRHAYLNDGVLSNGELPLPVVKPSFNEQDVSDKPSCPGTLRGQNLCTGDIPLLQTGTDVKDLIYQYKSMMAAMIAVDDMVGTIMDRLIANGIENDTVIIFTSDNGWFYGEHRATGKELGYEESIRVPLLIRAPGYAANMTSSQIVLNSDLAPTLAAFAGVTLPYDPDGTSLVPLLENPQNTAWHRKGFLVEHWYVASQGYASYFALRYLNAKHNFYYSQVYSDQVNTGVVTHREYYDLIKDPYQMQSARLAEGSFSGLNQYLDALRNCKGIKCRQLESFDFQ